ncbi:MAG: holo-ACP synthase [Elusimicrobiota bacterium]|jgi:holo-[acyl-carrier protein] synthase|nr:holo-ACP synthase [Elusimicrobiota bacterium]
MNIGIDIEEVGRFKKYIKDQAALSRIFSKEEIEYCLKKIYPAQHLGARFAAKEAVWKALNAKNPKILVTDISVKTDSLGKPIVYVKSRKVKNIDVSLSHTKDYVAAVAIVF